jgi:sec-independent protein translocase protein TatB
MFGIGSTELLVILLVALIVLGPKSLAGISRTLGKAMGEFRRVSTEFQRTLNVEAAREDEAQRKKEDATPTPPTDASASPVDQAVARARDEAQKTDAASTDGKA